MKTNKLLKSTTVLMISAIALVSSCNDEERITLKDTQDITEEALTDSYFQDMDDMAGVAVQSDASTAGGRVASGARSITVQDDRFSCSGIVVTIEPDAASTQEVPKGKITVDFGTTGCKDLRGNERTGKLIFTYNGRRFIPNSTVVTTGENYTINGVKIEGTRTLTNVSGSTADAPRFNIKLVNGKATFADGAIATRVSDITTKWVREASPVNDKLMIEQSSTASGVTRGGRSYAMSLLAALEFKRSCGMAVTGIKKFVIDGEKEITIDYGDGTCDKAVTITVNGVTRNITVK
jgi:hypothetical protein